MPCCSVSMLPDAHRHDKLWRLTHLVFVFVKSHVDHVVLTNRLSSSPRLTAARREEEHHAARASVFGWSI